MEEDQEVLRLGLWAAVRDGDVEAAASWLDKIHNRGLLAAILGHRDPSTGGSILHACVTPEGGGSERAEIAFLILEAEGRHCLHGHRILDMVQWLDHQGRAVVHAIAEEGDVEMARVLLDYKDQHPNWKLTLDAVSGRGWTPLHYSSASGHAEVTLLLLKHDAPLSRMRDGTALDIVNNLLDREDGDGCEDGRTWRLREVQSVLVTMEAMKRAAAWSKKQEAQERKENRQKMASLEEPPPPPPAAAGSATRRPQGGRRPAASHGRRR